MDRVFIAFTGRGTRFCISVLFTLMFFLRPAHSRQLPGDPKWLLHRAIDGVGVSRTGGKVLHYHAMQSNLQDYQSDRTYEPYFSAMSSIELWFEPQMVVQRSAAATVFPGGGPGTRPLVTLAGLNSAFMVRDTSMIQVPPRSAADYRMNVWMVLRDWEQSANLSMGKSEIYRDYPRDVIVRRTERGDERLFLDPKTGFPVKLDLQEKNYLWGQVHIEYVYSTWIDVGHSFLPAASFRVKDGVTEISRTVGDLDLVSADSIPNMRLPVTPAPAPDETPQFLRPLSPDTVRAGEKIFLLVNKGYSEGITMIGDTVYVFDATQGEERAKLDAGWIGKLFPGKHPVAVVVTDLAWPHVAGVRYWVSQGATIISHRASENFLRKIVDRIWTLAPDLLEQKRGTVEFKFAPVADSLILAGGKLRLYPIDGIGSEGALMAFLSDDRFLWASDYIQRTDQATAYAAEVCAAVKRTGIRPVQVAAEHIPITRWQIVENLQTPAK